MSDRLRGERWVLDRSGCGYPRSLDNVRKPPDKLYGIGSADVLEGGLAVIGARKATPYGRGCSRRFAGIAAELGVAIISGGARGCDSEAHRAALDVGAPTIAVLGGGCDRLYPAENRGLFQRIVDAGGAVVSEHEWDFGPRPYAFRERNRIIAGLASAVLIVEAGLPSGTFSTADNALDLGKDVLVVPGAITSFSSRGSNRLLLQGAVPVVDDESFQDALLRCGCSLCSPLEPEAPVHHDDPIVEAVLSCPMRQDELYEAAASLYGPAEASKRLATSLAQAEADGLVARYADGRWGPVVHVRR